MIWELPPPWNRGLAANSPMNAIVAAVKSGALDEKIVDQACERILEINYRYLDNARPETPWDQEADHQLSARIAEECMVLLKNDRCPPPDRPDRPPAPP